MTKRRLSRQQVARIRQIHDRSRERASTRAARQVERLDSAALGSEQHGLVIANFGTNAIIEDSDGNPHRCVPRQNMDTLVCGDRVIWQSSGTEEGVVVALEPRRTLLTRPGYDGHPRPVVANLDQMVLVIAPKPDFIESLLDRYLIVLSNLGIDTLLVLNKIDLLNAADHQALHARLATYQRIGYQLLEASNRSAHGLDALRAQLQNRTSILAGQSGVGKSSLIKSLLPDQDIRIRALSEATGLGTHTTTTSMLYHLPNGGDLIDSPGVRSFEPGEVSLQDLEHGFIEFQDYLGHCKFSNCSHTVEPECALREAVAQGVIDPRRFASFQQLRKRITTGN
ncbi:MAG: small ribosomal subunit biogenesis GTPase RsgA [Gammaproteobacteria bacterium]